MTDGLEGLLFLTECFNKRMKEPNPPNHLDSFPCYNDNIYELVHNAKNMYNSTDYYNQIAFVKDISEKTYHLNNFIEICMVAYQIYDDMEKVAGITSQLQSELGIKKTEFHIFKDLAIVKKNETINAIKADPPITVNIADLKTFVESEITSLKKKIKDFFNSVNVINFVDYNDIEAIQSFFKNKFETDFREKTNENKLNNINNRNNINLINEDNDHTANYNAAFINNKLEIFGRIKEIYSDPAIKDDVTLIETILKRIRGNVTATPPVLNIVNDKAEYLNQKKSLIKLIEKQIFDNNYEHARVLFNSRYEEVYNEYVLPEINNLKTNHVIPNSLANQIIIGDFTTISNDLSSIDTDLRAIDVSTNLTVAGRGRATIDVTAAITDAQASTAADEALVEYNDLTKEYLKVIQKRDKFEKIKDFQAARGAGPIFTSSNTYLTNITTGLTTKYKLVYEHIIKIADKVIVRAQHHNYGKILGSLIPETFGQFFNYTAPPANFETIKIFHLMFKLITTISKLDSSLRYNDAAASGKTFKVNKDNVEKIRLSFVFFHSFVNNFKIIKDNLSKGLNLARKDLSATIVTSIEAQYTAATPAPGAAVPGAAGLAAFTIKGLITTAANNAAPGVSFSNPAEEEKIVRYIIYKKLDDLFSKVTDLYNKDAPQVIDSVYSQLTDKLEDANVVPGATAGSPPAGRVTKFNALLQNVLQSMINPVVTVIEKKMPRNKLSYRTKSTFPGGNIKGGSRYSDLMRDSKRSLEKAAPGFGQSGGVSFGDILNTTRFNLQQAAPGFNQPAQSSQNPPPPRRTPTGGDTNTPTVTTVTQANAEIARIFDNNSFSLTPEERRMCGNLISDKSLRNLTLWASSNNGREFTPKPNANLTRDDNYNTTIATALTKCKDSGKCYTFVLNLLDMASVPAPATGAQVTDPVLKARDIALKVTQMNPRTAFALLKNLHFQRHNVQDDWPFRGITRSKVESVVTWVNRIRNGSRSCPVHPVCTCADGEILAEVLDEQMEPVDPADTTLLTSIGGKSSRTINATTKFSQVILKTCNDNNFRSAYTYLCYLVNWVNAHYEILNPELVNPETPVVPPRPTDPSFAMWPQVPPRRTVIEEARDLQCGLLGLSMGIRNNQYGSRSSSITASIRNAPIGLHFPIHPSVYGLRNSQRTSQGGLTLTLPYSAFSGGSVESQETVLNQHTCYDTFKNIYDNVLRLTDSSRLKLSETTKGKINSSLERLKTDEEEFRVAMKRGIDEYRIKKASNGHINPEGLDDDQLQELAAKHGNLLNLGKTINTRSLKMNDALTQILDVIIKKLRTNDSSAVQYSPLP